MSAPRGRLDLDVDPRLLLGVLLTVNGLLVFLHVVGQWMVHHGEGSSGGAGLFDLNQEVSVPTWWQQCVLALAAAVASTIAVLVRRHGGPRQVQWTSLGVVLLLLSIDEGSEIHERLTDPMRSTFDIDGGLFWYAWLIPALAFLTLFVVAYLRFWLALDTRPRALMAFAGVLFVAGAVGVESASGSYESSRGRDFTYSLLAGAEETFEMVGAALLLVALVLVLRSMDLSSLFRRGPEDPG